MLKYSGIRDRRMSARFAIRLSKNWTSWAVRSLLIIGASWAAVDWAAALFLILDRMLTPLRYAL